ncbi:MAG: hypothetical protein ABEJ92_10385 [Halobacteriales archaeon]
MTRYPLAVEDGTVYVRADRDDLEVGDLDTIIDIVGGHAWTIRYDDWEKQHYPELDTADEGLTVDVVDTIENMTLGDEFVATLRSQPAQVLTEQPDVVPPRLGLFVGRLVENLEYGMR